MSVYSDYSIILFVFIWSLCAAFNAPRSTQPLGLFIPCVVLLPENTPRYSRPKLSVERWDLRFRSFEMQIFVRIDLHHSIICYTYRLVMMYVCDVVESINALRHKICHGENIVHFLLLRLRAFEIASEEKASTRKANWNVAKTTKFRYATLLFRALTLFFLFRIFRPKKTKNVQAI